jgi:triosephosphate isomerase (TIM)
MRPKLIVGNWKMNGTLKDTRKLLFQLSVEWTTKCEAHEVAVCPPFTTLLIAKHALEGTSMKYGAQNCYIGESGAFTGEISAAMLAELGCTYVILGHSERRTIFGETNDLVSKKLRAALDAKLIPIACIGETEDEREKGETESVLSRQIGQSLGGLTTEDAAKLVIAYEPIWAIGTGKTATPDEAQSAHAFIRAELRKKFGNLADDIRILYGGSVKPDNARALFAEPDIDGGLIGGASLDASAFIAIVETATASN